MVTYGLFTAESPVLTILLTGATSCCFCILNLNYIKTGINLWKWILVLYRVVKRAQAKLKTTVIVGWKTEDWQRSSSHCTLVHKKVETWSVFFMQFGFSCLKIVPTLMLHTTVVKKGPVWHSKIHKMHYFFLKTEISKN